MGDLLTSAVIESIKGLVKTFAASSKTTKRGNREVEICDFESWSVSYLSKLYERIAEIQILRMPKPIQLTDLFIDPFFFEGVSSDKYHTEGTEPVRITRRSEAERNEAVGLQRVLETERC